MLRSVVTELAAGAAEPREDLPAMTVMAVSMSALAVLVRLGGLTGQQVEPKPADQVLPVVTGVRAAGPMAGLAVRGARAARLIMILVIPAPLVGKGAMPALGLMAIAQSMKAFLWALAAAAAVRAAAVTELSARRKGEG